MVTDAAAMAVVRAARPALHGAHDGVAFAAHAAFLAAGYSLCAVGPAALADPSPSGDEEVGIDGWNSMENCYAFLYSKEEKGKKKKVLVKCLVIGEVLAIDVLDLEAQDKGPYIIQINVKDFFVEEQPKNYGEMYKNFASLIETVNSNVLCKLDDAGVEATKSTATKNYDAERSSSIQSSEGRGPRTVDPSRQMDNSWRFTPGFSDMQQGPNLPWMKMLQMPVQVEGATPGAQTDSVPHDGTDEASASQRTKPSQKAKQINFSVDEDKILVSCWLNVNLDPITAVGQRKASFWKTIERNYNTQKALSHPVRTLRSLEGRWADIKEQANKFESHYNLVLHENHGGYNDMNKVTAAIALYNSIERKPFTKIHCWEILRNEPKWLDLQKKPGQPQSGCGSGAPIDLTDSAAPEEDSESQNRPSKRPIGRDKTKSAKRAAFDTSGSQSSSEHTSFLPNLHIQKLELYKNTQGVVASEIEKLVSVQEKAYKHEQIMANQLLELKKKKWEAHVAKEEERIMSIDLTTLNPAQRTYYENKQRLILERLTRGIDE